MFDRERLSSLLYLSPVFAALVFTVLLTLAYDRPVGADYWFHLDIARAWARGENGWMRAVALNGMPYPPLFHFILVPSVWLGQEILFGRILQVVLLPSAVASMSYFFWVWKGRVFGLLSGALVLGSYAFVDRSMQVAPQSLDMILLPLIVLFALRNRVAQFVVLSVLLVFNHGTVSILILSGLFVYDVMKKHYRPWLYVCMGSLVVILYSSYYFLDSLALMTGRMENLQEIQFWSNPLFFILGYQRLIALGFPILAWNVYRKRVDGLGSTQLADVAALMVFSLVPMILPWADRFVQYTTIPLTMLIVEHYARSSRREREIWKISSVLALTLMLFTLIIWVVADSYYVVV